ncbi:MAG: hypothetical protein CMJ85_11045 [Planctomycetes bacterium]|jgi:hypothetical protein|nr:hypothetical protein [Planctomycetota bacterium]
MDALALLPLLAKTGLAALGFAGYGVAQTTAFGKPFYNETKTNRAVRGAATTQVTALYMMHPGEHHHGQRRVVELEGRLQDEDASTAETVTFVVLPYAANGQDPDVTPSREVARVSVTFSGTGRGPQAFLVRATLPKPVAVPDRFGIGVLLPAAATWPKDGVSVHGQLSLPADAQRPRVPAPFNTKVWAFDRPGQTGTPKPLGGRTLDTLRLSARFSDPVLRSWLRSHAYGLGWEILDGPETLHPIGNRFDQVGVSVDAGKPMRDGWVSVWLASKLAAPVPFGPDHWYLDSSWFVLLDVRQLDSAGHYTMAPPIPFLLFPPVLRKCWLQAMVLEPQAPTLRLTNAVGFDGR